MRLVLTLLFLFGCVGHPQAFVHAELAAPHQEAPCSGCHGESLDEPVDTECAACHRPPDGHSEGACDECHDGQVWQGQAFVHALPLPHQGEVELCAACHPPEEPGLVDCLSCHEHRAEVVSPPHTEVGMPGYEFKTSACLRCHPDGRVH